MKTPKPSKASRSSLALRFAGGTCMGALMVSVPFAAGFASPLSPFQITLGGLVVVASGLMSCLWGDQFLDTLSRALDATSV